MNNLLVFTCNYAVPSADTTLLRRSCDLNNIPLQTYGDGQSWPGYAQGKIIEARKFLETREEPYAMFVDGRDTIILDSADAILERYQRIGSMILVSGEKTCWPDVDIAPQYPYPPAPFHNSPWRFINAGGWIGERLALIKALDRIQGAEYPIRWPDDDQRCWTELYLRDSWARPLMRVDAGCQIFQCMGGVASHELGPTGENLVTHALPKVLHFNGRTPNIGLWYRTLTGDLGWKGN